MRIYSMLLLVSTAVLAHVTSASRVLRANTIATGAPFVDAAVNQLSKEQDAGDDEARMPQEIQAMATELLSGASKSILFDMYSGVRGHKLNPDSWGHVIKEDETLLKRVFALDSVEYGQTREAILRYKGQKEVVSQMIYFLETAYRADALKTIRLLMEGKQPVDLVRVLKDHGFFDFRYANVQVVKDYLVELNAAKGSAFTLLDTLSEGFGEARLASLLSTAKLSPFTGHTAALLQRELLTSWENKKKSMDNVADLLGLSTLDGKSLTYENMDSLIEYVRLRLGWEESKAISFTLEYLRSRFRDAAVVQAIMKGKAEVQSAQVHLRERYEDESMALDNEEHNEFVEKLENELLSQWWLRLGLLPNQFDLNPFGLLPKDNMRLQAKYKTYFDNHNSLSLAPPGT